jgi:OmpA-OmpF porin, OOP family
MKRIKLSVVLVLLTAMFSVEAAADSQTFNALFFKPALGRNPYLMLEGSETLQPLQFDVGEIVSYGYHPLEMRTPTGTRVRGIIDQSVVADFVAAFAPIDWLQLGVDFPLILINKFTDPSAALGATPSNQFDMGDLRFEIKARVLDQCKHHIGLAFVPFITVPTGKDAHYVGDPGITGGIKIALDGRVTKYLGLTFNVGYLGGKKVAIRNIEFQHRLLIGGGVQGILNHGINVFGEVNAIAAFNKLFQDRDMNPVEGMVGVRWDIKRTGITIKAGGGSCFVCGVQGARIRGVLGIKYRLSTPKFQQLEEQQANMCGFLFDKGMSMDEVYRLRNDCPPDPADFQQGINDDACPKYYEIRDLADLVVSCPSTPEKFNPRYHDAACPKVFTLPEVYSQEEIWSIYNLAVLEMGIRCPSDPSQFNSTLHDTACPKYYDLKDVVTLAEKCPANANNFKAGIDDAACPKFYTLRDEYSKEQWAIIAKLSKLDTDNDLINDYLDRCPNEPEDMNGFVDDDGCPDGGAIAVAGGEIRTALPVYFKFNDTKLSDQAKSLTEQVVAVINKTPWIRRVRIGGNADARGTPSANELISKKRAQVVIDYMRSHGLRSGVQLVPIAYGSNRPVASNETEEGRALNRRVVFNVQHVKYMPYTPTAAPTGEPRQSPIASPPPPAYEPQRETISYPDPVPSPADDDDAVKAPQRWDG